MRSRFQWILPICQVPLAILLLVSNLRRPDSIHRPTFLFPDWQICHALNAPVAVVTEFFKRSVSAMDLSAWLLYWCYFAIDTVVFVFFVAILWYVVGIEVDSCRKGLWGAVTRKSHIRGLLDLVFVAFGVVVVHQGQLITKMGGFGTVYSYALVIPYVIWGCVIAVFYGRDLWAYQSAK